VDARFDRAKGTVTVAPDPAKSTVHVSIEAQSLQHAEQRPRRRRAPPDFFAAAKYPVQAVGPMKTSARRGGAVPTVPRQTFMIGWDARNATHVVPF